MASWYGWVSIGWSNPYPTGNCFDSGDTKDNSRQKSNVSLLIAMERSELYNYLLFLYNNKTCNYLYVCIEVIWKTPGN